MNWQELNELDLSDVGNLPLPIKGIIAVVLCGAVIAGGYYLNTEDQLKKLERAEAKEKELKQDFEIKQAKATSLEDYKLQLEEMKQSFGAMLRQLPDKTEVADLLVDVSQTGLAAGLEFELFKPEAEQRKDFYAELPISIRVLGQYHEFGEFISGLAALPRIVTIHDVKIRPQTTRGQGRGAPGGKLIMEATARTYRYLEEEGGA